MTTHEVVFRIFMAPIQDESGRQLSFREQRLLMIEMDKFVVKGNNILTSFIDLHNDERSTIQSHLERLI